MQVYSRVSEIKVSLMRRAGEKPGIGIGDDGLSSTKRVIDGRKPK